MIKGCSPQLGHFFTCADAAYELRISVRPSVSQMGGPKSNKTAMADMICRFGPKEPTYYTCDSRWNGETVDYVMPYDPKHLRSWPEKLTLADMIGGCWPVLSNQFTCDGGGGAHYEVSANVAQIDDPPTNTGRSPPPWVCEPTYGETHYYECRHPGSLARSVMVSDPLSIWPSSPPSGIILDNLLASCSRRNSGFYRCNRGENAYFDLIISNWHPPQQPTWSCETTGSRLNCTEQ